MARQPLRGETATKRIALRLTETEYQILVAIVRANSITISAFASEAIAEALGDLGEQSPFAHRVVLDSLTIPRDCSTLPPS